MRYFTLLAPLLVFLSGTGCQNNASLPVAGRVVQNDRPVPYSVVRFTPATQGATVTMVAKEGLFSSESADSAITPGENQVTVVVPAAGEEALPVEYSFTINVPYQGESELVLDLAQAKKR